MKTALITGGSKGIGLEMVRRLLEQGFQVITCSRNKSGWDESIRQYPILEAVDYHVTDISDEAALKTLFGHVAQRYGKLDIAVNNASPAIGSLGEFHTVAQEKLKDTLNHDFWAQAVCLQSELNLMSEGAAIVNVSSINGLRPTPNASMYSAAKHAIEGLTRSLAIENIERGIRINAVAHKCHLDSSVGGKSENRSKHQRECVSSCSHETIRQNGRSRRCNRVSALR